MDLKEALMLRDELCEKYRNIRYLSDGRCPLYTAYCSCPNTRDCLSNFSPDEYGKLVNILEQYKKDRDKPIIDISHLESTYNNVSILTYSIIINGTNIGAYNIEHYENIDINILTRLLIDFTTVVKLIDFMTVVKVSNGNFYDIKKSILKEIIEKHDLHKTSIVLPLMDDTDPENTRKILEELGYEISGKSQELNPVVKMRYDDGICP